MLPLLRLPLSGDVVMRQGDMGNEMYFIGEGSVEVSCASESSGACIQ